MCVANPNPGSNPKSSSNPDSNPNLVSNSKPNPFSNPNPKPMKILTAGMAAPLIAGGFVALGAAGTGAAIATGTGYAVMLTLFGTGGAGLMGYKMQRRTSGVQVFKFHELYQSTGPRTRCSDSDRSFEEWEMLFEDFYKKHNPTKVASVRSLLLKYPGQEKMVWIKMHNKYGQDIPAQSLEDAVTSSSVLQTTPPSGAESYKASSNANALHVVICVTGWLTSSIDFHAAWGGNAFSPQNIPGDGNRDSVRHDTVDRGGGSEAVASAPAPARGSFSSEPTRGTSNSTDKLLDSFSFQKTTSSRRGSDHSFAKPSQWNWRWEEHFPGSEPVTLIWEPSILRGLCVFVLRNGFVRSC